MGCFYGALNGIKGVHSPRFCRFPPRFFPLKGSMLARFVHRVVHPTVRPTLFSGYFLERLEYQKSTVLTLFFSETSGVFNSSFNTLVVQDPQLYFAADASVSQPLAVMHTAFAAVCVQSMRIYGAQLPRRARKQPFQRLSVAVLCHSVPHKKRAARRPFLAVTPSSSHVFTRQPISCQSSTILPYQLNQIKASLNQN